MIDAWCTTESSVIKEVVVKGHSSGSSENKVVCAAVSILVRTLCELVSRYSGVMAECSAPNPGDVMLYIHDIDCSVQVEMSGVTDYFLLGLVSIVNDYPESIKLKINNKDWYNGTQERWW